MTQGDLLWPAAPGTLVRSSGREAPEGLGLGWPRPCWGFPGSPPAGGCAHCSLGGLLLGTVCCVHVTAVGGFPAGASPPRPPAQESAHRGPPAPPAGLSSAVVGEADEGAQPRCTPPLGWESRGQAATHWAWSVHVGQGHREGSAESPLLAGAGYVICGGTRQGPESDR